MNKLDMESKDIVNENIQKISELFPNVIVESNDGKTIDFDLLKQELSKDIVEGIKEKYQLTWPGKKEAIKESNVPINKTLLPDKNRSINYDVTNNIFIEGDNLEVLKILQESYLGKIKMIYIDPPYNTGKDFIYNDKFQKNIEEELLESGQVDEEGKRMVTNNQSNGRFHSDWLSMMYSRIKLSRNLLKDDGIIFISIDDNEVHNLRKICDEIYGETNFVAQIIVEGTPKNDPYIVSTAHEYCLVYVKDFNKAKIRNYGINNPIYAELQDIFNSYFPNFEKIQLEVKKYYSKNKLNDNNISNYKYADKRGIYRIGPIDDPQKSGAKDERINPKTGRPCVVPNGGWRCNIETWKQWVKEDLILFSDKDDSLVSKKTYITEDRLDVMKAYFKIQTRKDTDYLKKLFELEITPFSNPKPKKLLKTFIRNCNDKEMICMDFFAGSGSFGDAVIETNAEDKGNRKFILVQVPQKLNITFSQTNKEKKITNEAIKYLRKHNLEETISSISIERIKLALKKIKEETNADIDYGFRVYKVDSTNMKDVYYMPNDLEQGDLLELESNIKEERTTDDLLTQVILDLGLTLDLNIEEKMIGKNKVYYVAGNSLVACFDDSINIDIVDKICECEPYKVVFKDSAFKTDNDKINLEERFKKLLPQRANDSGFINIL